MSIRWEVTCDVCLERWDAADYVTAQYDLESHLENDHWGTIKEIVEDE